MAVASGLEQVFAQGAAALDAGDLPGAEQIFRSIVEAEPRAHPAWNALSVVAVRSGFPELALERSKHALELDRRNALYLNNLGVAYGELGLFADSEQALRRALKAKPAYAEGHFNLGKVLHKQGRRDEALRAYERAYAMESRFPGLRTALVHMYCKTGRAERARAVIETTEGAGGEDVKCFTTDVLAELEGPERAIEWLREQLAQGPQRHELRYALGQLLLGEGQWREGWRQFLIRGPLVAERVDGSELRPPALLPARLDGRSVLLRRDMGLGDSLFFLRFAAELRGRGAVVSTMASANLARILPQHVGPVVEDAPLDPRVWDHDILIGDLPALLDSTEVPAPFELTPEPARIERLRGELARLGPAPYLGLTWRAGTDVLRGREFGNHRDLLLSKEVPPAQLGKAVRGWPGTLVALQRAPYPSELEAVTTGAGAPVHDLSALNEDLPDMLAALALLDEYAAVSNTNIHMLAGLGRSGRALVPYPGEWRWTRKGTSPWFPDFRLYLEPRSRGWDEPLAQLRKDLGL